MNFPCYLTSDNLDTSKSIIKYIDDLLNNGDIKEAKKEIDFYKRVSNIPELKKKLKKYNYL